MGMNHLGRYLAPPPLPDAAHNFELRAVAGGTEGVTHLWQSLWFEGVWRGAVSAAVVFLALWLALITLAVLLRGRP